MKNILRSFVLIILSLLSSYSFGQKKLNHARSKNTQIGQKLYADHCLSCHQEDGGGVPPMNPPLNTSIVNGEKEALIKIVLKGMMGKVKIDGKFYNNVMAPHAYLKDEEIASILTYVRTSFGNKSSSVSPEEVKTARLK